MGGFPLFLDWKVMIVQITVLPREIYRLSAILQILMILSQKYKPILKLTLKHKRLQIVKTILSRLKKGGRIPISCLRIYHKNLVIKTV